jgi:hypothetical protein
MLTLKVSNQGNSFNFAAKCFYLKLEKNWENMFSQQEFATYAN